MGPAPDDLPRAAADFRYLLERGYPRAASLTLVGNRYQLTTPHRQLLHRGVFAPAAALRRQGKTLRVAAAAPGPLGLDGHNVLITLECGLAGMPLVLADDGFIRDIAGLSRSYRPSAATGPALKLLAQYLRQYPFTAIHVWYDAPMSRSGELAARTAALWQSMGLPAWAWAVPVPETYLLAFPGPVASSDTQVLDGALQVVDLAGEILLARPGLNVIRLSPGPPEARQD